MSTRQLSNYDTEGISKEDQELLDMRGIAIRLFREAFGSWDLFYIKKVDGFYTEGGHIEKKTKQEAIDALLHIAREMKQP